MLAVIKIDIDLVFLCRRSLTLLLILGQR